MHMHTTTKKVTKTKRLFSVLLALAIMLTASLVLSALPGAGEPDTPAHDAEWDCEFICSVLS